MKHVKGFENFNEGRASKIVGAAGVALAAATGAGANNKTKEKETTEYSIPDGRKSIIEDLQQCLKDNSVRFKKMPDCKDAQEVREYIDYLNKLCDKNEIGLKVKSKKK